MDPLTTWTTTDLDGDLAKTRVATRGGVRVQADAVMSPAQALTYAGQIIEVAVTAMTTWTGSPNHQASQSPEGRFTR